jgi:hypothetical protein
MNMSRASRKSPPDRNCALQLEALEDRRLLTSGAAAQVTFKEVPATLVPGTMTLVITGTKKNDSISISDNGTEAPGNIFVSANGANDYMSVGAISEVAVETGPGKDHVAYELDGNLQSTYEELVLAGSDLKKGGGSLQLTVNIVGKVLTGSTLAVLEESDPSKPTTMTVNDSGDVDGFLETAMRTLKNPSASKGSETYSFHSTAAIGTSGEIASYLVGSSRKDVGSISYSGTNNGEVQIGETGNGGGDQLEADVFMAPGSTGTVGSSALHSKLKGTGKDKLRFTIDRGTDSTSKTGIYADVVGTSKKDATVRTANVASMTKGSDMIVLS